MKVSIILAILVNTLITVICIDSCEDGSGTCCSGGRNALIEFRKAVVEYTFNFLSDLTQTYPNLGVNGLPLGTLYLLGLMGLYSYGNTCDEILRAMNLKSKQEIRCVFSQINEAFNGYSEGVTFTARGSNVFIDKKFTYTQCFERDMEEIILGCALNVDLCDPAQAANDINRVIARETINEIQNVASADGICEESDSSSCQQLLFYSGFYFSAEFLYGFNIENSIRANFYGPLGTQRATYFCQTAVYGYLDSDELDAQILSVPYRSTYRALVFLPNENADRDCIIQKLKDYRVLDSINRNLTDSVVEFCIPNYISATTLFNAGNIARRHLDVPSIFDPNQAQFQNITEGNQCFYAATGIQKFNFGSNFNGGPTPDLPDCLPTVEFRLNRPHIYLISACVDNGEETTYIPLFVGLRTSA